MGSCERVVESHYVLARCVIGKMFMLRDYGIMFVVSTTNGADNPLRTFEKDWIESRRDRPDRIAAQFHYNARAFYHTRDSSDNSNIAVVSTNVTFEKALWLSRWSSFEFSERSTRKRDLCCSQLRSVLPWNFSLSLSLLILYRRVLNDVHVPL